MIAQLVALRDHRAFPFRLVFLVAVIARVDEERADQPALVQHRHGLFDMRRVGVIETQAERGLLAAIPLAHLG
jgi:hypothetical protein